MPVAQLVIEQGPPHYDAAPRHKSKALGLTVRDLTFEVRRYLKKTADQPGVVISKIDRGSKAAVAGLKPYEVITHVNAAPVMNVGQFQKQLQGQAELRLSVSRMARSRVVEIKLPTPKAP